MRQTTPTAFGIPLKKRSVSALRDADGLGAKKGNVGADATTRKDWTRPHRKASRNNRKTGEKKHEQRNEREA